MSKKIEKRKSEDETGYNQMPPEDIFAYNELRSCSDLFALYKKGILEIQPEFQRNEVWPSAYQTRFIDSLLKEMPIPSMCFSYDKIRNEMRVIDGLQRMSTIIKFLDTKNEFKLIKLEDIDPRISGKSNVQIQDAKKDLFDNIANLSLPVTFLRVDHSKPEHDEYLFEIFHRLNTYGKKLNDQEIRNCIYSGSFNSLIKKLGEDVRWRKLLNFSKDTRFQKVELILRFFAFFDESQKYEGVLTKFLNDYMSKHRNESEKELEQKESLFKNTVSIIFEKISNKGVLSRKPSRAFFESLLFGVANNLQSLNKLDEKELKKYYQKFEKDNNFKETFLLEGTMKKAKVAKRLKRSRMIFSGR